ncbi:MAG: hypothetical protein AB8B93_09175 [Pseudomonadales bacterium]
MGDSAGALQSDDRILFLLDVGGRPMAQLPLRAGRYRAWHFGAFAALAAMAGYCWVGLDAAGLLALAYRAHYSQCCAPTALRVHAGLRLWMAPRLVVVSHGWLRYSSFYADEFARRDYVRMRRVLKRAAAAAPLEPLDIPDFGLV